MTSCPLLRAACLLILFGFALPHVGDAAAELPAVAPVMSCAALLDIDWTKVPEAPSKLNSVEETQMGDASYCKVAGYVAPKVRFEILMPKAGWTQRFHFAGSGGYAGSVSGSGRPLLAGGPGGRFNAALPHMVQVATDLGHANAAAGSAKAETNGADGLWALGDPGALVDFGYAGNHKVTVVAKAIVAAYYGQKPKYSYFSGCSDGGRQALQEAQRFPDDFDGIIAGAPVIDDISTNTMWHAWFWRSNTDAAGKTILTKNKLPVLNNAVRQACGVRMKDGTYDVLADSRACRFDARTIATSSCNAAGSDACLTPAQAEVANKWWQGPVDKNGQRLAAGGTPYGSELFWGVPATADGNPAELGDYAFSRDFPNFMSAFNAPTGILGKNMAFDAKTFDQMEVLTGLFDPTNPDLNRFRGRGGKLLLWTGAADSGASPYMVLNYYDALKTQMGKASRDTFTRLYMIPGAGHCQAGGADFYTPIINWVEQGVAPDKIDLPYAAPGASAAQSTPPRARSIWPHPATTVYDVATDGFVKGPDSKEPDRYEWRGLSHYSPEHNEWCGPVAAGPKEFRFACRGR